MDDLALALRMADLADARTLPAFERQPTHTVKPDVSLVSEVDLAVETDLREYLSRHRPDDVVVGEEYGTSVGEGDRVWTLDTIDHTNNFARRIPVFATLISLSIGQHIDVGVVSCPRLGRRWFAERGGGAFRVGRDEPIHVSPVESIDAAYLSFAALHEWDRRGLVPGLVDLAGRVRFTYGSGGFLAHVAVAEGLLDVRLDPWGNVWDLAPIQLIVEEAGGRLTDLSGRATASGGCAVVTNGLLHDEVLRALR